MSVEIGSVSDRWARLEQLVPPYPAQLFELLQTTCRLPLAPAVVDLGAGTGRASLPMAARGWRVIAVDSDGEALAGLRARAEAIGCDLATVVGRAEASRLDPGIADLVTAAHAFHWFEPAPALAEMARVLRPGGAVALFWNVRHAESSPLVVEYHDLLASFGVDPQLFLEAEIASDAAGPILGTAGAFDTVERHDIAHAWPMTIDTFTELALMPGFVTAMTASRREAFRQQLDLMLRRHADTNRPVITIPYRTTCWIARRSTP